MTGSTSIVMQKKPYQITCQRQEVTTYPLSVLWMLTWPEIMWQEDRKLVYWSSLTVPQLFGTARGRTLSKPALSEVSLQQWTMMLSWRRGFDTSCACLVLRWKAQQISSAITRLYTKTCRFRSRCYKRSTTASPTTDATRQWLRGLL